MKCHHGYQSHHASGCPFDFPDPHNYRELMEETLLGYKCGGASVNKMVGIITLSSQIEETNNTKSPIMGAIMPNTVLGAGSGSEEDVSAPLTVNHLHWTCSLMGSLNLFLQ